VGFGVGHDIQYHQSITNIEDQDAEEDNIIDETRILGNYMELNCSDGRMSDTNINTDGKTTEDTDEEEASENSDMEDKFSDMENGSEGDEEDLEFEF